MPGSSGERKRGEAQAARADALRLLPEPPTEVFTTNDLPSVSVEQVGKPKELRWRKKGRKRR